MPLGENWNDNYLLAVAAFGRLRQVDYTVTINTNGVHFINKSADYTLASETNSYVLVDTTAGDVTITLPPVADAFNTLESISKVFAISKKDSSVNKVIVDGNGANILGSATQEILYQYEVLNFITDGTEWYLNN